MEGCHLEGNITDPRNTRMEDRARTQRWMEASTEGGQGTVGVGRPRMDGWMNSEDKLPNAM
jgi:hypothetical protein